MAFRDEHGSREEPMIFSSIYSRPEALELIESVRGFWDGKGWVAQWELALRYSPTADRAQAACRTVEQQTGQRCWVFRFASQYANN
jgi:hypothetical protein